MEFKEPVVLWKSRVGSHMWRQHHSKSDVDEFKCYIFDSKSFLLGNSHKGGHTSKSIIDGIEHETTSFEIGHVIKYLLDGNLNFLWGVMSPRYKAYNSPVFHKLRRIVRKNVAKNTIHSARGFIIHNLRHWFGLKVEKQENGIYIVVERTTPRLKPDEVKYRKILNTCGRTLGFAATLIGTGKFDFAHPLGVRRVDLLYPLLGDLEHFYENSPLKEKPDPKPYHDFLLKLRLENLGC